MRFRPWPHLKGGHGARRRRRGQRRLLPSRVFTPTIDRNLRCSPTGDKGRGAGSGACHHHSEEMRDTGLTVEEEGRRSPLASPPTSMGSREEASHAGRPPRLLQPSGAGAPRAATVPCSLGPPRPAQAQIGPSRHVRPQATGCSSLHRVPSTWPPRALLVLPLAAPPPWTTAAAQAVPHTTRRRGQERPRPCRRRRELRPAASSGRGRGERLSRILV
jgi:hypothetical protein